MVNGEGAASCEDLETPPHEAHVAIENCVGGVAQAFEHGPTNRPYWFEVLARRLSHNAKITIIGVGPRHSASRPAEHSAFSAPLVEWLVAFSGGNMNFTKKELRTILLRTAIFLLLALIGFEFAMDMFRPSPDERDALLGWRLKEDYHRTFAQRTLGGQQYLADFATNRDGFRVFGTDDKAPFRILVLGDSFTADPYGSNDKMWYGKMVERLAVHMHRPLRSFYVLAGGGGGWGTYQELLLSQRIARAARPNLFVLQFCSNDFQNNSYEWESESVTRAQWMRRPFWDPSTRKTMFAPGLLPAIFRSRLGEMRLFNRIDSVIAGIQFKKYGGYFKPLPPDVEAKYERDSIAVTRAQLVRLRQEYRGVPAVAVNCDGEEFGPNKQWKNLMRDAGFIPLAGPSDFLRSLTGPEREIILNSDGSHLSNDGNQRYGAIAGDEIALLGLLR